MNSDTMTVTVRDRSAEPAWISGPGRVVTRKVTISAYCPRCGARRGKPTAQNQYDDGEWYSVDSWTNPCGHVDMYASVVKESHERKGV